LNKKRFAVTLNLKSFLIHARQRQRKQGFLWDGFKDLYNNKQIKADKQYIWIDAICIDQNNIYERNSQVGRMKEIYERAHSVIVWLGPAAYDSHIAMRVIRQLAEMPPDEGFHMPDDVTRPSSPNTPFGKKEWQAVEELYHRKWWDRAWILQEATAPTIADGPVVWCGFEEAELKDFGRAYDCIFTVMVEKYPDVLAFIVNSNVIHLMELRARRHPSVANGALDLLRLLPVVRDFDASDKRDKIYSVLAISADGQDKAFQPDYSKPTSEVYTNLAKYILQRDRALDLLGSCCSKRCLMGLPSWVPDWSTSESIPTNFYHRRLEPDGTYTNIYSANNNLPSELLFMKEDVGLHAGLQIKGIDFATVTIVSEPYFRSKQPNLNLALRWSAMALSGEPQYPSGESRVDSLRHVLCADVGVEASDEPYRGNVVNLTQPDDESYIFNFQLPFVNLTTSFRRLFRTSRGYLGIGPEDTQPGDRICILTGGHMPLVMRPTEDFLMLRDTLYRGSRWTLIGESYVHGIMDGEAMIEFQQSGKEMETFEIR